MTKINKGIIFDLDGVLVDTAKYHFQAWRKLANDLGFDIDLDQNEQLKGVSRIHSLKQILKWGNKEVPEQVFNDLMELKNTDYLERIAHMTEADLLPGVKPVLDHLTASKVPFALGSASRNARGILKSLNIYERFVAVVDGNDVQKAKPDPEVFLIAASKLGIACEGCIVFEDSVAGVEAANRAGMISIGIGSEETLKHAHHVFTSFNEIDMVFLNRLLEKE